MIKFSSPRIIFSLALFCFSGVMAVINPPYQCPDEPTHLAYSLWSAHDGRLPLEHLEGVILASATTYRFWSLVQFPPPNPVPTRFYEAPLLRLKPSQRSKPTLYYLSVGKLLQVLRIEGPLPALYVSRLVGLCFAFLQWMLLWSVFLETSRRPDDWMLWSCTLMLPQYVYLCGSANPANLAWVASGMMILGSVRLVTRTAIFPGLIWIIPGILLGLVVHRSVLIALPGVFMAIIIKAGRYDSGTLRTRWTLRTAFAAGVISSVIWILIANRSPDLIRLLLHQLVLQTRSVGFQISAFSWDTQWWAVFFSHFFSSFMLNFGWLKHPAPVWFYGVFGLISLPVMAGVVRQVMGFRADPFAGMNRSICLIHAANCAVGIWIVVIQFACRHELSQGRYLFPILPSLAAVFWFLWNAGMPTIWQSAARGLVYAVCWGMLIYSVWGVLIPRMIF